MEIERQQIHLIAEHVPDFPALKRHYTELCVNKDHQSNTQNIFSQISEVNKQRMRWYHPRKLSYCSRYDLCSIQDTLLRSVLKQPSHVGQTIYVITGIFIQTEYEHRHLCKQFWIVALIFIRQYLH